MIYTRSIQWNKAHITQNDKTDTHMKKYTKNVSAEGKKGKILKTSTSFKAHKSELRNIHQKKKKTQKKKRSQLHCTNRFQNW